MRKEIEKYLRKSKAQAKIYNYLLDLKGSVSEGQLCINVFKRKRDKGFAEALRRAVAIGLIAREKVSGKAHRFEYFAARPSDFKVPVVKPKAKKIKPLSARFELEKALNNVVRQYEGSLHPEQIHNTLEIVYNQSKNHLFH